MALLDIANTDRIYTITPVAPGAWVPGIASYTENYSNKVKTCGKSILIGAVAWTMSKCTLAGGWVFSSGSGSLTPTATKTHEMDFPGEPVRKTDKGQCHGAFTKGAATTFCTCDFEVTDAGQNKVRCQ